ncbi:MAG: hypothetical protein ACI9VR_000968 [Cognaticolwellia sp.]|jgi:uncharacterized protein (DUF1499 family)
MILALLTACAGLTINDVTTGETQAYPELKSMRFPEPTQAVFDRAEAVALAMPGWQNCTIPEPFLLTCEAVTPKMGFIDDVSIWVAPEGPGMSVLKMRSASRQGKGDLGANAKRIQAYQEAFAAYRSDAPPDVLPEPAQ